MYARMTSIQFTPAMRTEVVAVARGLVPILEKRQGFQGLDVLTDPSTGEGVIIALWETEATAAASETDPAYIGQMSMMSSFLHARIAPKTYEVNVHA